MLFPNLPEKWKKAIPLGLTSLGSLALFIEALTEASWAVLPNIFAFAAIIIGALFGLNWTPPDRP